MTISLITFSVAIICGALLLLNKKRELGSAGSLSVGNDKTDQYVLKLQESFTDILKCFELSSLKKIALRALHFAEKKLIDSLDKAGRRFEVFGRAVTGQHIPKNRGSVSFFLKNIENREKGGLIK